MEEGGTIKVEEKLKGSLFFASVFLDKKVGIPNPLPVFSTICKPNWPKGDAQKVTIHQRVKTINVRGEKAGGSTFPMIRRAQARRCMETKR